MIWTIVAVFYVIGYIVLGIEIGRKIFRLKKEIEFLTKVRANQAHYIACLQSEISQLKESK